MIRVNRLVILLRPDERQMLDNWAARERLPTGTAARRALLFLADGQKPRAPQLGQCQEEVHT